ncbi:MAG: hypothetical protein LBC27_00485 [Spirochaetaceae bacterium]|nr:hypothetical protein [Spirochaetaceae bacterium]
MKLFNGILKINVLATKQLLRRNYMTFYEARREIIKCSGKGIRRPCWKDKSLRITGDKQFAEARAGHKGRELEERTDLKKVTRRKQETVYDGSDLFYQTDVTGYSDGDAYNGKSFKLGYNGEGLPYGKEDYLAKDWEFYMPDNLK